MSQEEPANSRTPQGDLERILEQLIAIRENLERLITLTAPGAMRLDSAVSAVGIAVNCIRIHIHPQSGEGEL